MVSRSLILVERDVQEDLEEKIGKGRLSEFGLNTVLALHD